MYKVGHLLAGISYHAGVKSTGKEKCGVWRQCYWLKQDTGWESSHGDGPNTTIIGIQTLHHHHPTHLRSTVLY